MTPDTTTANMQSATPAPDAATTKAKARQKAVIRFPYQVHASITPAMNRSIERLSGTGSLLAVADIIRMSLHHYLLSNDAMYQRELGGNRHNAA
jgi:hypothetical protein